MEEDADPNLVNDPLAPTPVELAANNQKDEMVQFLLSKNGQAVIPLDSKVHTQLSRLVHEHNEKAILESFAKGEQDEYGRSVTHYCAHLGKVDLLKQMHGNMDIKDNKGRTPLQYAIIKGHKELTEYLIGEQANCALDSKDHQGYAPLMQACQYNQNDIARLLLERAKEKKISIIDISDNFGWKAVHKAAQVGNVELVKMFVEEYNVDPNQRTTNERTPWDLAKTTNSINVMEYLNSRGISISEAHKKV